MKIIHLIYFLVLPLHISAQFEPNYNEAKVPDYELTDLLITNSGDKVNSFDEWKNKRRPEILNFFEHNVYGKIPESSVQVEFKIIEEAEEVLDGYATRKQVKMIFSNGDQRHSANILIYLPVNREKEVPLFIGYNFYGNHTIYPDPEIIVSESWVRDNNKFLIHNNRADGRSAGCRSGRWPVMNILNRGYGLAVMYYGDIDPDYDDGFHNGIHPLFDTAGGDIPGPNEWGSISAWAYGLIKAMDYFVEDPDIDKSKIAVLGHSRLGKTSLWAGAMDQRFAMVISNESGCGGAALSKRKFGETVGRINNSFPHWFCDNFNHYNNNEEQLPMDQHGLIALMAPRPVYVASAAGDRWADPRGEFLAAFHASEVYRLAGLKGLGLDQMPGLNQSLQEGHVAYHIRSGEHDLTYYDWQQFLDFADRHFGVRIREK